MRKKVVRAIVGLAVFIVAAAGIGYALGILRAPELEGIHLSWGEVASSATNIIADISVNNRLPFGIRARSVAVNVPIYFYEVEAADLNIAGLSLPPGQSTLSASATMFQANLPQWWPEFVQQGEQLAINIKPVVKARILGVPISAGLPNISTQVSIPIMSNMKSAEPITMGFDNASILEIVRDPSAHFTVSPPTPARPIVTMESWQLHWGSVTQQQTQILGTVMLRNELSIPIPIQGLRIGLDMNTISVITDVSITPSRSELPPGQTVPLAIEANIDNNKLVQWWTSHLENGENTAVTARLGLTVVLPVTSGLGLTQAVQLPLLPVPLFECDIHTYIMDVANYQIAKMLGKAVGTEPKSYVVNCNVQPPQLASTGPLSPLPSMTRVLSVSISPTGSGTVLLTPPSGSYPSGTVVALTAVPALGYAFDHWGGDVSETSLTITVTMDSDKGVTAYFKPLPSTTCILSVSVSPTGSGTVLLMPPGGSYPSDTVVALTAVPAPGYAFDHWSGDVSGTSLTITVTMDSDKSVTAYFKRVL